MPFPRYQWTNARVFKHDTFPLFIGRIRNHKPLPLHYHQFDELVIVMGGTAIHYSEDGAYSISAGDVFIITNKFSHGYRHTDNLDIINILYDSDNLVIPKMDLSSLAGFHVFFNLDPAFRKYHNFKCRLRLSKTELSIINKWLNEMKRELRNCIPGYQFITTSIFMRLIGFLSRKYHASLEFHSKDLLRFENVISFIDDNYFHTPSLSEMSKIANMSVRSFLRYFKKALGISPIEYVIKKRISKATELLDTNAMSIKEIAFQTGFKDSNYFARQFHKIIGMSPSEYRKKRARPVMLPSLRLQETHREA